MLTQGCSPLFIGEYVVEVQWNIFGSVVYSFYVICVFGANEALGKYCT